MRTSTLTAVAAILMISSIVSGQYNYNNLSVNDPQRTFWYYTMKGSITEASLNIKPHGTYLEYDLYLTLKATVKKYDYSWYNNNTNITSGTQLETVLDFTLPANSFITDSWLWVGDSIMQAILIDKWTARNIYEGIVNRRKDPSILYKTSSNSYQLRVYPITTGMNRKLKISYMVPFNFGQEYITAPLPLNILKTSDTIPDFKVTIFPDNMSMRPLIFEYTDISFSKNNNTFTTIIPSSRTKMSSIMNIALANPCSDGLFFNKTTVNGENYYQLAFTPSDLLGVVKNRKIALVLDYDPYITNYYTYSYYYGSYNSTPQKQPVSKDQMLSCVKYALLSQLAPGDSFNILFNYNKSVKMSNNWLAATEANIETYFSTLSTLLTQTSLLNLTLPAAVDFICKNDSAGSVLIISNSDEYCSNATQSKSIIQSTLTLMRPGNIPVNVIDFATSYYGFYDGTTYYRGNDYLYSNITRTTQGNYLSVYSTQYSLSDLLIKGLQQFDGKIPAFDYHLSMSDGYCYSRYNNDAAKNYCYNKPIVEYGKFAGSLPFILEINANVDHTFISKKIEINESNIDHSLIKTNKIWAGNFIQSLEYASTNTSDIADLIKASIDNRVLCKYTAFLALEPSDSIHACQDCDENSMGEGINTDVTTPGGSHAYASIKDTKADSTIDAGVYPNPFTDKTTVNVRIEEETESLVINVYNIQGQLIRNLYNSTNVDPQTITIDWTGDDDSGNSVSAGVYIIVINTDGGQKVMKVIKQ